MAGNTNYLDPGIPSNLSIFNIQARCTPNTTLSSFSFQRPLTEFHKGIFTKRICYIDFIIPINYLVRHKKTSSRSIVYSHEHTILQYKFKSSTLNSFHVLSPHSKLDAEKTFLQLINLVFDVSKQRRDVFKD